MLGHGLDESRLTRIVAQQSPQQGNVAGEGVLRNRRIPPDPGQQFFFRDQLVWIAEQHQQNPERLRFHLLHPSRFDDGKFPFAHSYIRESENKRLSCDRRRHHNFFRNSSGLYQDDSAGIDLESRHRRALKTHAWVVSSCVSAFRQAWAPSPANPAGRGTAKVYYRASWVATRFVAAHRCSVRIDVLPFQPGTRITLSP